MTIQEKQEAISFISDLHKDVYGYRPRGMNFMEWSDEKINQFTEDLCEMNEIVIDKQRKEDQLNSLKWEELIDKTIKSGAGDKETAIRWIYEGEMSDNEFNYGVEEFMFRLGISFNPFVEENLQRKIEKIIYND